jgi:hypothetical protein
MKSYKSQTANQGTTIILDSVVDAIALARQGGCHETAIKEITTGVAGLDYEKIDALAELICAAAQEIQPSLASSYQGFERAEEGLTVDPGLLAASDPAPCFRRRRNGKEPKSGISGDGAYRVLICTDISWWGEPQMECAMVAAFVKTLSQFHPVEVWVQQGWLGPNPKDGVTLFKLDFAGGFALEQLSFWICSLYKDIPFSSSINIGENQYDENGKPKPRVAPLGRKSSITSVVAETEADIWLRGDWMRLYNFSESTFCNLSYDDQCKFIAKWLAASAFKIVFGEDGEEDAISA